MAYKIIYEAHVFVSVDDDDQVSSYELAIYSGMLNTVGPYGQELTDADHGWDIPDKKLSAIELRTECAFEKLTDLAKNMLPDGELKVIPLQIEEVP